MDTWWTPEFSQEEVSRWMVGKGKRLFVHVKGRIVPIGLRSDAVKHPGLCFTVLKQQGRGVMLFALPFLIQKYYMRKSQLFSIEKRIFYM